MREYSRLSQSYVSSGSDNLQFSPFSSGSGSVTGPYVTTEVGEQLIGEFEYEYRKMAIAYHHSDNIPFLHSDNTQSFPNPFQTFG